MLFICDMCIWKSTITDFTSNIIANNLSNEISKSKIKISKVILCGGGRKNKTLINRIKTFSGKIIFETTEDYNSDGDFLESQAFAYLAIRSYLGLPISFPETTGCKKPITGGIKVDNF